RRAFEAASEYVFDEGFPAVLIFPVAQHEPKHMSSVLTVNAQRDEQRLFTRELGPANRQVKSVDKQVPDARRDTAGFPGPQGGFEGVGERRYRRMREFGTGGSTQFVGNGAGRGAAQPKARRQN